MRVDEYADEFCFTCSCPVMALFRFRLMIPLFLPAQLALSHSDFHRASQLMMTNARVFMPAVKPLSSDNL